MKISIRNGLALIFGTLLLVVMVILGLTIGSLASTSVLEERGQRLADLAYQVGGKLDQSLSDRHRDLAAMASFASDNNFVLERPELTRAWLSQVKALESGYAWIGLVDDQGQVLVGTGGFREGGDVGGKPWFNEAQNGHYYGDLHGTPLVISSHESDRHVLDIAVPVKVAGYRRPHVIAAHLDWHWISDLVSQVLEPARRHQPVDVVIVNEKGELLPTVSTGSEKTVRRIEPPETLLNASKPYVLDTYSNGRSYLTGIAPESAFPRLKALGWRVLVRQDKAHAVGTIHQFQVRVLSVSLLLAVVFIGAVWWVSSRLSRPLVSIASVANRLRRGERNVEFPGAVFSESRQLVRSIKALLTEIAARDYELEEANQSLEQRVEHRTFELERALAALAASESHMRTIADSLPLLISYVDRRGRYQYANATYYERYGVDPQSLKGKRVRSFLSESEREVAEAYMRRALKGERVRYEAHEVAPNGEDVYLEITYIPHFNDRDRVVGAYVMGQDVSFRKLAEQRLKWQAHHDVLTGTLNRRGLELELRRATSRAKRGGQALAIMFLDLDHFKAINDNHGHGVGDQLLELVAERLTRAVRDTDVVGRIAGDEFMLVLEGLKKPEVDAEHLAQKILAVFDEPLDPGLDEPVQVASSIGVAVYQGGDYSGDALVKAADDAMYEAKRQGRRRCHIEWLPS